LKTTGKEIEENPQNPKRFSIWLLILSVHHAFRMNNNPINFNKNVDSFFLFEYV